MKTLLAIVIGIAATAATPTAGQSAPILDQAFIPDSWTMTGLIGGEPETHFGQSFTAGLTGKLSKVRLELYDTPMDLTSPPLRISVFSAPNGDPAPFPLTSVDIVSDNPTLQSQITFATPIDVIEGRQYLISAHYPSLTHSLYPHSLWSGWGTDGYLGGAAFTGVADSSGAIVWQRLTALRMTAADFSFETFVEVIPEPTTFMLSPIAAVLVAVVSRIRGSAPSRRLRSPQAAPH